MPKFVFLMGIAAFLGSCMGCKTRTVLPSNRTPLSQIASQYHFLKPTTTDFTATLQAGSSTLVFSLDSRKLLVNGVLVFMNDAALRHGRDWSVSCVDLATVIEPLLGISGMASLRAPPVVVLDAGHGGDDSGALGPGGSIEKHIVLDITSRAAAKLRAAGVDVRMTRSSDSTVSLPDRIERTQAWCAGLLVSIHANSAANTNATGVECYVIPAAGCPSSSAEAGRPAPPCHGNCHDMANTILSYRVHRQLLALTGAPDRGVRRARFYLLRQAPCPAILVECGFLSNSQEEAKLETESYRETVAEAIALGILSVVRESTGT